MHYHYCIIGGGIAGVTAAETLRERVPEAKIAIVSGESLPLYSRVMLPSFVKGDIDPNHLMLRTVEDYGKKEIDFFAGRAAVKVTPDERAVVLDDGTHLTFDKLLIASGGVPKQWQVDGGDKQGIFRLHTIEDAERLKQALSGAKNAAVAGDKFIALEFLEIFRHADIPTTIICKHKNMLGDLLDSAGVAMLHEHLQSKKISIICGDEIAGVEGHGHAERVFTKNGLSLPADIVGVGIGLRRNFDFLNGSGVALGTAGVRADKFLETNVSGIYAAGDVAEYDDVVLGNRHTSGNWTGAFLQGKIAGANMAVRLASERQEFRFVPFYSMKSFGMHLTFLGSFPPDHNDSVSRVVPDSQRYERFFFKDGYLAGAVLFNGAPHKPIVAQLVEKRIFLGDQRENLSQMDFDIATLAR